MPDLATEDERRYSEREARRIIARRLRLDPPPDEEHEDDTPRYSRAEMTIIVGAAVNEHKARQRAAAVEPSAFEPPDGWEYLVATYVRELAQEHVPAVQEHVLRDVEEPPLWALSPSARERLRRERGDAWFSDTLHRQLRGAR